MNFPFSCTECSDKGRFSRSCCHPSGNVFSYLPEIICRSVSLYASGRNLRRIAAVSVVTSGPSGMNSCLVLCMHLLTGAQRKFLNDRAYLVVHFFMAQETGCMYCQGVGREAFNPLVLYVSGYILCLMPRASCLKGEKSEKRQRANVQPLGGKKVMRDASHVAVFCWHNDLTLTLNSREIWHEEEDELAKTRTRRHQEA